MTIPAANANAYFETDASGWATFGCTFARSTAQAHEGAASGLLTADGVTATPRVESTPVSGVVPGAEYRADVWVRTAVTRTVSLNINWYTSAGAYLSTSTTVTTTVTAGIWTAMTVAATAPATAARYSCNPQLSGTPAAGTLLYIDEAMVRPAGLLTITADPANMPPRMIVQLEYPSAALGSATIVRADPDGTQTPVRLAEPATLDGSGTWVGYDYESWFGSSTTYTATTSTGSVTSTAVTLGVADVWLRHPGIPSLSQLVDFQGEGEPVRAVVQAVLQPLGRTTPVVVSDGQRRAKTGVITLRTKSDAEHAGLLGLLADVTPLLLDVPPDKGYGADLSHQYLAIGDLTQARLRPDFYPHPWRIWTAPYYVVGRPAGGTQAQRTYADILADFTTYQDVLTRYATYTDMLTGA